MIHRSVNLENFAGRSLFYLGVERPDRITVIVLPSRSSTSGLRLYVTSGKMHIVICLNDALLGGIQFL